MKTLLFAAATFLLIFSCTPGEDKQIYKDKNADINDRIDDLLNRMTLDEKILQMNQWSMGRNTNINNVEERTKGFQPGLGSYIYQSGDPELRNLVQKRNLDSSRIGIPIIFGYDVIHGFRTIFPIPLAQACSWNTDLVNRSCEIAAKEAWLSGIDWTFSPMIDVSRDPRWGRIAECYGEDQYTNAVFCISAVDGYQGENLSDSYTVAACLKHFVGYGLSEGGRDYHFTEISDQALWDTYLIPYEAGIKAGAATVMSSFNDISGIPATAHRFLLTDVLKERWEWDGFVVSDWKAVDQLQAQGVAADRKEAAYKALTAGVEMDMNDNIYNEELAGLVEEGKISTDIIDDAVKRILRLKFELGLFDQPYTPVIDASERYLLPEYKSVAEELTEESMVLLKNERNTLPLNENIKSVALVGPIAKDKENLLGSWWAQGKAEDVISVYEGLEAEFNGDVKINYAMGCDFEGTDRSGFSAAVAAAGNSDIIIACLGEKRGWSGENANRSTIALPSIQEELITELKKTGKPIVLVLSAGRPNELIRLEPMVDAIIEIWQPGIMGGPALAGIISGRVNPSGKLAVTFPLASGQIPVYYNMRQAARPKQGQYQDIPTKPLYWFGHGLSYTTYEYGDVQLSETLISKDGRLTATVEVTNSGDRSGKETVHWFISDPAAKISRPMKELKHFEKKELDAGEKAIYTFEIDPMRDLSYVDSDGNEFLESGDYYVIVRDQRVKFIVEE